MAAVVGIPATRLQAALAAAARPTVLGHDVVRAPDGVRLLKIRGANLHDGVTPEVHLAGHPVEVLESSPRHILVRPLSHHDEGQVEVFTSGQRVTGFFRLGKDAERAAAAQRAAPGSIPGSASGSGNGAVS